MSDLNPLERFRAAEAAQVRPWFGSGLRILDIGAGSGYQASLFDSWGCLVTAVDIDTSAANRGFWPVQVFDGIQLPFGNRSFDVVFSSNVLEHVHDRDRLLDEIRRVLTPEGVAVHIVPSATWRFWTSAARCVNAMNRLLNGGRCGPGTSEHHVLGDTGGGQRREKRVAPGLADLLLGPPHGDYVSTWQEYSLYRRVEWLKMFRDHGFKVVAAEGNHLFYTGYTLVPALSTNARSALSKLLGSSCHVFVLRLAGESPLTGSDIVGACSGDQ